MLSPSTALLQWSAGRPASPLSLSVPFLSSPLPLPSSTADAGHLLLTDLRLTETMEVTLSSLIDSDGGSDFPSESAHASLLPAASDDPAAIDLSGARLQPEVGCADAPCTARRVRWTASPAASALSSPPLLYSVFVEWSAHTLSAAAEDGDGMHAGHRTRQPALSRQSMRLCTVHANHKQEQTAHAPQQDEHLRCNVPADRLPRGVELTLHLLTECDYRRLDADGAASLPHCLSAVSSSVVVHLPLVETVPHSSVVAPMWSQPAPSLLIIQPPSSSNHDSAVVRAALCHFFNLTTGTSSWLNSTGWCDNSGISYCHWFGLSCNSEGEITSIALGNNLLNVCGGYTPIDINAVFVALPRLQFLNLSSNFELPLRSVNISTLSELTVLDLTYAPNAYSTTTGLQLHVPLILPINCSLLLLNVSHSFYVFDDLLRCASLQHLYIAAMPFISLDLTTIGAFPDLRVLVAADSPVTSASWPAWLYFLDMLYPRLDVLDISGCTALSFKDESGDNWPIVRSQTLRSLSFGSIPQLATSPAGPSWATWLSATDLPSLRSLNISNLLNVAIDTQVFATASQSLESIVMANTPVIGSIGPLTPLQRLQTIVLDSSNIVSSLPPNISLAWPQLTVFSARGCNLAGPMPSFQGLPLLNTLLLSQNGFVGGLDPEFVAGSPGLVQLDLSQNQLTGPMPNFANHPLLMYLSADSNSFTSLPTPLPYLPSLIVFTCSNNLISGSLDPALWQQLPSVQVFDASTNQLLGVIPSPPAPFAMELFSVGNNEFNSPMPINIIAMVLDLSFNRITGPLRLLTNTSATGDYSVLTINLESTMGLECRIELAQFSKLHTLILANGGFRGCDWTDPTHVSLPPGPSLIELDISHGGWLPMAFEIPPSLQVLRAIGSNVHTLLPAVGGSALTSITLDQTSFHNPITDFNTIFALTPTSLRTLSCSGCGLKLDISQIFAFMHRGMALESLILSANDLSGRLPPTLFSIAAVGSVLPLSMRVLDLSSNPRLTGPLPTGDSSYSSLQEVDVSDTAITGPIPDSWHSFSALQRLTLLSTSTACVLQVNPLGQLFCKPPLGAVWIEASTTSTTGFPSTADPAAQAHCPAMSIASSNSSTIAMDPSYHASTLCVCDAGSFGLNALCYRCPEGCTCSGAVIQDCFPVLQLGLISAGAMQADSNRFLASPQSTAVQPFTLVTMLPCPRTITGQSLCNPDGIAWIRFYNVTQTSDPSTTVVRGPRVGDSSDEEDQLSGWCYPGHTGRLCAACSSGYFSSGRWCLRCLSEGVHVLILIANLLLIIALIAYLFLKSPKPTTAVKALAAYRSRMRETVPSANGHRALIAISPPTERLDRPISGPSEIAADDAAEPVSEAANPLKLLIFHSQQLSLLLQTTASMPNVIAGLMSAVSSGSNGFSLSSLVAMECLNSAWSMEHRCWLAIVAPLLIAAFAGLTFLLDRRASSAQLNHGGPLQLSQNANEREQALLAVADDADVGHAGGLPGASSGSSSPVPRIYGVCVSLLYLLVFPCAQTALSALTCTDTRERTAGDNRVYLNLFPAQQCDDEWSRTILPPALLGALFWLIVFPLCSTLRLRRLKAQLHSASSDSSSAALSAWPICSDLLSPFSPRFWFWEQILLLRRLMLVAAVTIIPSSSLYLPLALFALIQLCALLQHWTHPYAHPLLNAGELVSLYLLLLNYISALLLQTGLTAGGFQRTADLWAVVLFLVNFAFLLALVVGLFGFIRKWAVNKLSKRGRSREKAEGLEVRS